MTSHYDRSFTFQYIFMYSCYFMQSYIIYLCFRTIILYDLPFVNIHFTINYSYSIPSYFFAKKRTSIRKK